LSKLYGQFWNVGGLFLFGMKIIIEGIIQIIPNIFSKELL
jgi:hypothetical protein